MMLILMTSHVKNENLQKHMLSVEAAMRFYARKYGEDEEIWGMAGLLHDSDYEEYPDLQNHTQISTQWLRQDGYDEITGMVTATSLVRPDKSVIGLEVASVRKKMKAKGFAAGVHREDLYKGAEELGIDLDEHIANVIEAMSSVADTLGLVGKQEAFS